MQIRVTVVKLGIYPSTIFDLTIVVGLASDFHLDPVKFFYKFLTFNIVLHFLTSSSLLAKSILATSS